MNPENTWIHLQGFTSFPIKEDKNECSSTEKHNNERRWTCELSSISDYIWRHFAHFYAFFKKCPSLQDGHGEIYWNHNWLVISRTAILKTGFCVKARAARICIRRRWKEGLQAAAAKCRELSGTFAPRRRQMVQECSLYSDITSENVLNCGSALEALNENHF